jgi:NADPH:quinone reductase-like Zn-dependent oxidoreductase
MAAITEKNTMRQSMWTKVGPFAEVLKMEENAPKPVPGPSEVLIKVRALSINPIDWKLMEGHLPAKGKEYPRGWGTDVAGIIESLGADCDSRLKVGDEVISDAIRCGPMAEFCVVALDRVSLKPKNVSFRDCVGISLAGLTALQAIRDHGAIKKGQRVCIFGGSGGVGTAAIQLAKILGASYVGTTSTNEELCKRLGADKVVNYKTSKDIAEDLGSKDEDAKYDIVFDAVGGKPYWQIGQAILKKSTGKYIT